MVSERKSSRLAAWTPEEPGVLCVVGPSHRIGGLRRYGPAEVSGSGSRVTPGARSGIGARDRSADRTCDDATYTKLRPRVGYLRAATAWPKGRSYTSPHTGT